MQLIVVRHGIALEHDKAAERNMIDRDRPLTAKGRSRMKRAARGLAKRFPRALTLVTSPLRRAIETAEILGKAYGGIEHTDTPALLPDADPAELAAFLAESASESPVAVVGHEPHLGRFIGWSLIGEPHTFVDLRKGAACLLHFEDAPGPGKGKLVWLAQSALLRRL